MSFIVESDSIGRRLILAKEALVEAQQLVIASQFDLSLMRAVWQADFALDLALPALFDHMKFSHPIASKKGDLPATTLFLDELKKNRFSTDVVMLSLILKARRVHNARNVIQHGGTCFSQADSVRYVNDARDFLDELLQKWIGVDLYGINLSLINTDKEAQLYFDKALEHVNKGEYKDASQSTSIAYRIGYDNLLFLNNDIVERDRISVQSRWNQSLHIRVENTLKKGNQSPREVRLPNYIHEAIKTISEPLGLTQFGVELNTAVQFLNLLPKITRAVESSTWISYGEDRSYSKEEAEYLFDQALLILYRIRSTLMI
jgi:hypothetical protein